MTDIAIETPAEAPAAPPPKPKRVRKAPAKKAKAPAQPKPRRSRKLTLAPALAEAPPVKPEIVVVEPIAEEAIAPAEPVFEMLRLAPGRYGLRAGEEALLFERVEKSMMVAAWPAYAAELKRVVAQSHGCYTLAWFSENFISDAFQLWHLVDADHNLRGVLVTHMHRYPTGLKEMQILGFAGHRIGVKKTGLIVAALKDRARRQGCDRLYYGGRDGFLRSDPDWKKAAIAAVMDL